MLHLFIMCILKKSSQFVRNSHLEWSATQAEERCFNLCDLCEESEVSILSMDELALGSYLLNWHYHKTRNIFIFSIKNILN